MSKVAEETIARLCYEVNKAYCESLGDYSFLDWDNAPDWQKETILDGVRLHLQDSSLTPEKSHENWLKHKEKEGWKYGEIKNPEKKEHPCFVPYDKLPPEQKAKDYIFKAICDFFKQLLF